MTSSFFPAFPVKKPTMPFPGTQKKGGGADLCHIVSGKHGGKWGTCGKMGGGDGGSQKEDGGAYAACTTLPPSYRQLGKEYRFYQSPCGPLKQKPKLERLFLTGCGHCWIDLWLHTRRAGEVLPARQEGHLQGLEHGHREPNRFWSLVCVGQSYQGARPMLLPLLKPWYGATEPHKPGLRLS